MVRQTVTNLVLGLCAGVLLTGCMPKMTIEDMKAHKPERPAELDKLNDFVGTWKTTGKATFAGMEEPIEMTGDSEVKWAGDGWYLVGQHIFNMGELGQWRGMETWSYDARAGKFRTSWVDSMGGAGYGTAWHNDRTDTWHMKGVGYSPHGKMHGKGTVTILDDGTQEWKWREYAMLGLMKVVEMTGVSEKQ